jgi:hypothetical protein
MAKEDLVDLLKKILNTDADLDFLPDLKPRELEILTARISHKTAQEKQPLPSSGGNPGPCRTRIPGIRASGPG